MPDVIRKNGISNNGSEEDMELSINKGAVVMKIIEFILLISIFVLFVFVYTIVKITVKLKRLSSLLKKGKVNLYLRKLDKLLKKLKDGEFKNKLLISKSAVLGYKGDFEEAITLMQSLDPNVFEGGLKTIYYNNLIYKLLLSDRFEEAKQLFLANNEMLNDIYEKQNLNDAIIDTIATYEFYSGNIEKSKELFLSQPKSKLNNINLSARSYFLALIYLKEGNKEFAHTELNKVLLYGNELIYVQWAKELLAKL